MNSDEISTVHPIELTVQSLLETPLETLNLNLKSLYESQMILHTILYKMERTIMNTANNLRSGSFPLDDQILHGGNITSNGETDTKEGEDGMGIDYNNVENEIDLKSYLERVIQIRKKLKSIEKIIDRVEARICRIEGNLGLN